jgi:hypothetical protein
MDEDRMDDLPKDIFCYETSSSAASSLEESTFSNEIPSLHPQSGNRRERPKANSNQERYRDFSQFFSVSQERIDHPKPYLQLAIELEFFPLFQTMGYPQDSHELEVHVPKLSTYYCRVPRRRRISLRTRLELWQHQLGKPFRALSELQFNPRHHTTCFGDKVINSVFTSQPALGNNCADSAIGGDVGYIERQGTTSPVSHYEAQLPEGTIDTSLQTNGEDLRWLYSKTVWPVSTSFTESRCHFTSDAKRLQNRKENIDKERISLPDPIATQWDAFTLITAQPTQESSDEEERVMICDADLG